MKTETHGQARQTSRGAATPIKALALLDIIAAAEKPPQFRDLQEVSGLPKPTLHRMLQTLLETGLVRFRPVQRTYAVGLKVLDLARTMRQDRELGLAAQLSLSELSAITGEAAQLALLDGTHALYSEDRRVSPAIRHFYSADRRVPLHCTAVGKAMLAFLDANSLEALVHRLDLIAYTPATLTTPAALLDELKRVRAQGFAVDDEELEHGLRCVAAPIRDLNGDVLSAIGISGPSQRLTREHCESIGAEAIAAATATSERLRLRSAAPAARRIGATSPAECVYPATAFLGDSPLWDPSLGVLWWLDILAPALHRYEPLTGASRATPLPRLVSAIALTSGKRLIATTETGFALLDPATGALDDIDELRIEEPGLRFNDGKCDRAGRFWAGTMNMWGAPTGALYRRDLSGEISVVLRGLGTTNGIGWSPDNKIMYVTDTAARTIFKFDFNVDSGHIANQLVFARVPEEHGEPGGLTVDREGTVWSANWNGWCVTAYDPSGRISRIVPLPVPRPSSCSFGGPDFGTLFVTSARVRLSSDDLARAPLSGSLFALHLNVAGLPEPLVKNAV